MVENLKKGRRYMETDKKEKAQSAATAELFNIDKTNVYKEINMIGLNDQGGKWPDYKVSFSIFTSTSGLLTKTIRPGNKGGITKVPSAHMTTGHVTKEEMLFSEFGPFLRALRPNQAIGHGVCIDDYAHITTTKAQDIGCDLSDDYVTRTKEYFQYPSGPGLAMFDHDPKDEGRALSPDKFREIVVGVWPEFNNIPTWTTPSTSACIKDMEGNLLNGNGDGFHMYFPVPDASCLPLFADTLFTRMWLHGYGHIEIDKAGRMHPRTIFDTSVFSPERLDFVAGANCVDCIQELPVPVFHEGGATC